MQNILRLDEKDIMEAIAAYYGVDNHKVTLVVDNEPEVKVEVEVEFTAAQMQSIWANKD